jgi:hypothetical protein
MALILSFTLLGAQRASSTACAAKKGEGRKTNSPDFPRLIARRARPRRLLERKEGKNFPCSILAELLLRRLKNCGKTRCLNSNVRGNAGGSELRFK